MRTWAPPEQFGDALYDLYGLTCPPRWGTPRHEQFPTYGPAVQRIMRRLGTPPMPWQAYMLDVALEVDPNNLVRTRDALGRPVMQAKFVHREVGLSICRQQGKTASVLALSAHRLMNWAKQTVTYAAQNRISAHEKWEDDFVEAVLASVYKNRFRVRKRIGSEALICKETHSMMGVTSNTEKASHGDTLDLGLIDEAFSHEDDRLEQAFGPAMITKPMAQKWWLSAGGTERSLFLNRKRETGRAIIEAYWRELMAGAEKIPNVAYFEWFPDEEANRSLFETWLTCMPALCPEPPCRCDPEGKWLHTITEDVVRSELLTMDPAEFDRAYLNRTRKKTPPPDDNIPAKQWPGLGKPILVNRGEQPRHGAEIAFAVDITPQRDHGSIAMYSIKDAKGYTELVAFRPGVFWIAGALKALKDIHDPLAIGLDAATGSPGATLLEQLLEEGFSRPEGSEKPRRGQLWVPSLHEYVAACGQMADDIRHGRLEHPDQRQLNVAVGGARTRPLGDAWALARKNASVNISPFIAATVARGAYLARVDKVVPDEADPGLYILSRTPVPTAGQEGIAKHWHRPSSHLRPQRVKLGP